MVTIYFFLNNLKHREAGVHEVPLKGPRGPQDKKGPDPAWFTTVTKDYLIFN